MAYLITFRKSASKQIRLLPKTVITKITSAIDELADEPCPANCKKLKGIDGTYRIRIGDYRVLYTIDDNIVTVEVIKVGHRKDIYE